MNEQIRVQIRCPTEKCSGFCEPVSVLDDNPVHVVLETSCSVCLKDVRVVITKRRDPCAAIQKNSVSVATK